MPVENLPYSPDSIIHTPNKSTPHPQLDSKNKKSHDKALISNSSTCPVKPNIETYGNPMPPIPPQKIKSVELFS